MFPSPVACSSKAPTADPYLAYRHANLLVQLSFLLQHGFNVIFMMYVPFIGRLSFMEWPMVTVSFFAAYFEFIVSIITKCIPDPLIDFVTMILSWIDRLMPPAKKSKSAETDEKARLCRAIRTSPSIQHMGKLFGYEIDDHIVTTKDGFLLCLHRIKPKQSGAPAVYLHHGLLMCSDIWCVNFKKEKNLPFLLHELGFDVWMGNNRGNKYSTKHLHLKLSDTKFWDFSIDEFAMYDIPDSINYVLDYSGQKDLTYIGFSQGSAQALAALSMNAKLNQQINLFIALAPAMTPSGLHHPFVDSLTKTSPNVMYLMFGKKTLLPTASFWRNIIYPPLFSKVIDFAVSMLFNWKNENISNDTKFAAFAHLYSPTSVKSVVHWFQIIRNSSFQLFDENVSLTNTLSKPFRPATFPTRTNIKVPIKLIYGTADSLVDINKMLELLPPNTTEAFGVVDHEHLDIIWGDYIEELVFPRILSALNVKESILENEKVTDNVLAD